MATVIRQQDMTPGVAAPVPPRPTSQADTDYQAALAWLLPDPIRRHGGRIETLQDPLHDAEAVFVRHAVARRVMEFTAGRACARAALRQLGLGDGPVPMGARQEPLWPRGAVGSISHAAGYCVAAAGPREQIAGIGIDIESADPLPDALINLVCTPAEKAWCERQTSMSAGLLAKFLFSAKEAVFKCLYPVFREEIDFDDAVVELDLQAGRFVAHVSRIALESDTDLELPGRLACTSRLVLTAAFLHDTEREWLTQGYTPQQLEGCEGRFICN